MTLSARNFGLTIALLLFAGVTLAADPPTAEMAAAATALASAEHLQPQGPAADALREARDRFTQAQEAMDRKKYRDALRLAEEARAGADLALARAQLAGARAAVDEKSARNADLRRKLLVLPESNP